MIVIGALIGLYVCAEFMSEYLLGKLGGERNEVLFK